MPSYADQLATRSKTIISGYIEISSSEKVPETADLKLSKNQGVSINATYLYADLVGSSKLAQTAYKPVTAKIIRSYINGAADILRHYSGEIRSFDGDRVMAIFIGENKETSAVRAALAINWLVNDVLSEAIKQQWNDLSFWQINHSIGIDTGEALVTRGGVRGDSDLISVGAAPNVAAKLSDLRDGRSLHITDRVYEPMSDEVAFTEPQSNVYGGTMRVAMWAHLAHLIVGGQLVKPLGSNYWWAP